MLRSLLFGGALAVCVSAEGVWHPSPSDLQEHGFGVEDLALTQGSDLGSLFGKAYSKVITWGEKALGYDPSTRAVAGENEHPYFGFIPEYKGQMVPGGDTITWQAECFGEMTATAGPVTNGVIEISLEASKPASLLCSDDYILVTVEGLKLHHQFTHGKHTIKWDVAANANDAELFDVNDKGIRVFRFLSGWTELIGDIVDTALLFEPLLTKNVGTKAAERNLDFLNKYSGFKMAPYEGEPVALDESAIHSGDFIGIVRLDGLDPMLAWAMGSTTGHTTVALWEGGQLYVCESTTSSSYWPTNGVQKTPYQTWIKQAQAAGHNAVHLPLNEEMRSKFNATAALDFFSTVEGFDYGFYTLLWGWIDTLEQNYPCLPPQYETCLSWQLIEPLFGLVDRLVPSVGDLLWNQGWNHRLSTAGLRTAAIYQEAAKQGVVPEKIPTMVEQTEWMYNTTRYGQAAVGPSQVCCVFVCNVWKAGGLFDDLDGEVECGELTNWDDYALAMFDTTVPANCQQTSDPADATPLCQVSGVYRLLLNDVNTKAPYAHMAETCPSRAPDYNKPSDC